MNAKWIIATLVVGAVTACGGGSSGDGAGSGGLNPTNPIAAAPPLTITTDNATETSAEAVGALKGAVSVGGSALDFGGAIGARIETDGPEAATVALDLAQQARDSVLENSGNVAVGAVITETQQCTGGGSTTVSINTGSLSQVEFAEILQGGFIPAGTSVSMTFNNCQELDQPPLNGGITVVFQQFPVDGEIGLGDFTLQFTAMFDGLSTPDGVINGDISFLLNSGVGSTTTAVSGDGLEITDVTDTVALIDFLVNATLDNVALVESFDFTLSVASLGSVTVETLDPWTTNLLSVNPITGALRIGGADNTSITITALDEVTVQLEVDTDGDDIPNETIVLTWAELNANA